ncbi:restriction endonuclease subunit S [Streptomyces sp. NBC_01304]|uniref:restriction endonuclease subunit S n=1 Tax=Streptomyces sp. NBC_01304 TaxID=2903818 RepID=UPI002E141A47|nr:restriction endonuclease subunit S [Streptomyces sp. NBC_01304]
MREMPADWTVSTVSDCFEMTLGKMLNQGASSGRDQRQYLTNRNVQWGRFELDDLEVMHFSEEERRTYSLRPGDLLVTEGGEIGRTAMWNGELADCYFQKSLHRLRAIGPMIPGYMANYMEFSARRGLFSHLAGQTSIAHLTKEKLGSWTVVYPCRTEEQRAIVAVLDAVADEERAIEASIAKLRTVRRGAQMSLMSSIRHSHAPLRTVIRGIDSGWSPICEPHAPGAAEWGVLGLGAVTSGQFQVDQAKRLPQGLSPRADLEVGPGDVLIARANGSKRLVGAGCVVPVNVRKRLMLSDLIYRLNPDRSFLEPNFLGLLITAPPFRRQVESAMRSTSGQFKISKGDMLDFQVPLISLVEQRDIVSTMAAFDSRIDQERAQLAKLRRLKQGLTDDLLSGKVRVKDLA